MATSAEVISANAENMIADARGAIQRAIVFNKLARVVPYLTGPLSGPMLVAQYFSNESDNQKNLIKNLKRTNDDIETWATTWRQYAIAGKRTDGTDYNWDKWGYSGEAYIRAAYDLTDMVWNTSPSALMLAQAREFAADPTKPTVDVVKAEAKKVADKLGSWWDRNEKNIYLYAGIGIASIVGLGALALTLSRPKIVVQTGLRGIDGNCQCRSKRTRRSHRR